MVDFVKPAAKILIVEDEPALRQALADEFTEAGFQVKVAADGDEGIAEALDYQPDLMIIDLLMPHRDGVSMMRELEKKGFDLSIPVIVLTNMNIGSHQVEDFVRNQPAWYLMKAQNSLQEILEKAQALLTLKDISEPTATVDDIVAQQSPVVAGLMTQLRSVLKEALPQTEERVYPMSRGIGYCHPEAGYICAIFPHPKYVQVRFEHGAFLHDPAELLQGDDSQARDVIIRTIDDIEPVALQALLQAALQYKGVGVTT